MKHKYADAIIAWANGEPIQYRLNGNHWTDFLGGAGIEPCFANRNTEWRPKKEQIPLHVIAKNVAMDFLMQSKLTSDECWKAVVKAVLAAYNEGDYDDNL